MTTAHALSCDPVAALDDLPPDIQHRIHEVHAKSGFILNVFLTLAHRPEELGGGLPIMTPSCCVTVGSAKPNAK